VDEGDQLTLVGLDVEGRVDGQPSGGGVDRRADEERHGHRVELAELAGGLPPLEQPLEVPGDGVVRTRPEQQGTVWICAPACSYRPATTPVSSSSFLAKRTARRTTQPKRYSDDQLRLFLDLFDRMHQMSERQLAGQLTRR
jgi:hypothetical protein